MTRDVRLILDLKAGLGESPRWNARERALYLVDIARRRLHRFDPAAESLRTRDFDQPVGCFAFRPEGGFVLTMADGFALIDSFEGPVRPIGPRIEMGEGDRFNDGRTDAAGRFFAGALDASKQRADAGLFRLDPDGAATRLFGGALTSNGAAFSADGALFAWADTPRHELFLFDFDLASGALSNRRLWRRWPHGGGRPDGGSFDEAGFYWTALYAGGRVARLDPGGEIVEEVPIPCPRPTMIAFGGDDRRTAFVTTAREGLSDAELEAFPHSGGVFAFRVETPGVREHDFAG